MANMKSGMFVVIDPVLCVDLLIALLILSRQFGGTVVWTCLRFGVSRVMTAVGRQCALQMLVWMATAGSWPWS